MIVEGMIIDRDGIAASFEGQAPWDRYELQEPRVIPLGADAAALVYRAVATRGDAEVTLRMSTTYTRGDDGWRVALHQQTPA
jgi:hypothetical protein